jgi:glycosyltransferase involved in cell wall biosynthesis
MLIRAPSPLLPFVTKVCIKNNIKYSYLIVGDYVKNLKESKNIKPLKRFILNVFYKYNRYYQDKYSNNALLFTNNPIIAQEYKSFNIKEIRTTTLSEKDFFYDETFYKNKKLNILYAGRIEPSKGIEDILSALKILVSKGLDVTFNLVGWDASKGEVHLNYLQNRVQELNLSKNFIFHGKKQVGIELFTMYRQSDIYVIATRGDEGFPRTIWEAMANSSVVISTKAGSIPIILKDKENAILVDKNSPKQISESIIELLQNLKFVHKLQENGYALAQTNTIEKQSAVVISQIKEFINEK